MSFICLLLDQYLLHLLDVRAWVPLGNGQCQLLQLAEVALTHVHGVFVRLVDLLLSDEGILLLLTLLQLGVNDILIHLLKHKHLVLQLLLSLIGVLQLLLKLRILSDQVGLQLLKLILVTFGALPQYSILNLLIDS